METDPTIVLVVEDEAMIRITAADALSDAGFHVIETVHAAAALAILHVQAEAIHALFTDIQMPGEMDGLMLAHHSRLHWPWIALLISSGAPAPPAHNLPDGSRFFAKPYDTGHVADHIRAVVARA